MTRDEKLDWCDSQPREVRELVHEFGFVDVFLRIEIEEMTPSAAEADLRAKSSAARSAAS